ncbi:MAG: hypothetical protein GF381_02630 [Candidatus Pacebacteria bacterium]|nr:hypothetical protein [Candidatus Paceibacterota bacterium]
MKIKQVYQKYYITPNLEKHMLWTAAVGLLVMEQWQGPTIDEQLVTTALLTHDLGNLVKFDLDSDFSRQHSGLSNSQLDQLKSVQTKFRIKYSANADQANIAIARELQLSERIVRILALHSFQDIPELLQNPNWEHILCLYGDLRISPDGLVSVKDRVLDLRDRYLERDPQWSQTEFVNQSLQASLELEKQLQQQTKTDLNSLSQQQIDQKIKGLLEFEI